MGVGVGNRESAEMLVGELDENAKTTQVRTTNSRQILRNCIDEGRSMSEELITERRLEFLGELDHRTASLVAK